MYNKSIPIAVLLVGVLAIRYYSGNGGLTSDSQDTLSERCREKMERSLDDNVLDLSGCDLESFNLEWIGPTKKSLDKIEMLRLENNRLKDLPNDLVALKNLKILFLSNNAFTSIPAIISSFASLRMLALRSNAISSFSVDSLPTSSLQWLILTNNRIRELPSDFGRLKRMKKLMLSGNRLGTLPDSMKECQELELIRLASNDIQQLPSWFETLPKLSWVALSGNPISRIDTNNNNNNNKSTTWNEHQITLHEALGEGTSGRVFRATMKDREETVVAVKIFKELHSVGSDGTAENEMLITLQIASQIQSAHANIVSIKGRYEDLKEGKVGLVLQLIQGMKSLGLPPSFDSITRDVFDQQSKAASLKEILSIGLAIASAMEVLHREAKVFHGDLYAHNILVHESNYSQVILSDFGAAFALSAAHTSPSLSSLFNSIQKFEVRSFGCLLEDLLQNDKLHNDDDDDADTIQFLNSLISSCQNPIVSKRPNFKDIIQYIKQKINYY